jgi:hypothetical protein
METCEHCGRALRAHETITCDDCAIAQLERILGSEAWLRVRGPFMGDTLRAELAELRARRAAFGA